MASNLHLSCILCGTLALAALPSATAAAASAPGTEDTEWFRVELVVFERLDPAAASGERFPAEPGLPEETGTVHLLPADYRPSDAEREAQREALSEARGGRDAPSPSPVRDPETGPTDTETDETADLPAWAIDPVAFRLLPEADLDLDDAVARMERSGDLRVLVHRAWVLPGRARSESPTVWLSELPVEAPPQPEEETDAAGSDPVPRDPANWWGPADGEADGAGAEAGTRRTRASGERSGTGPMLVHGDARLFGRVQVARERYLHLDVDLLLRSRLPREEARLMPDTASSAGEPGPCPEPPCGDGSGAGATEDGAEGAASAAGRATRDRLTDRRLLHPRDTLDLRLQDRRRMRSGEVHLLDHPYLGVMVLARPLPEPEDAEGTDD